MKHYFYLAITLKLNKKQREQLFNKYGGRCAYCGDNLTNRWQADHIEPIYRTWEFTGEMWNSSTRITGSKNPEKDTFENLNPCCAKCNLKKGTSTIEGFRETLSLQIDRVMRDSNNFRFALKYGQVKITKSPIVFYFEKFNK